MAALVASFGETGSKAHNKSDCPVGHERGWYVVLTKGEPILRCGEMFGARGESSIGPRGLEVPAAAA